MTAYLGHRDAPHPGDGLPDVAEELGTLLLRWWRLGLLPGEDAPVSCHTVSPPTGQLSPRHFGLSERLATHLQTAMPQLSDTSVEPENTQVKGIPQITLASYFDTWMGLEGAASNRDVFEKALVDSTQFFELMWPSGRRVVAPLSELCALRIAEFLMREPNPMFFSLAEFPKSRNPSADCLFFDPRWLLPTVTARAVRDRLLSNDQRIYVEPSQLYLASAFLPELLGQMVLVVTTEDEVGAMPSKGLGTSITDQFTVGKTVARFSLPRSLMRISFVRFGFMALAHVLKKILEPSAQNGSWQLRLVQRLTGPWSSRRWFGRSEFRQLKKLVNWAGD